MVIGSDCGGENLSLKCKCKERVMKSSRKKAAFKF